MEIREKQSIELLAPARDYECGIAAIMAGADAIYIGAPKYGARKAVGNSIEDIERLTREAHKYFVRVYCTVNTIIFDHELNDVRTLIHTLYDIGVDALIVQDLGILEMDIPPIPLIASTQMHNYDVRSIQFLESVGFQRIILARELSLEQIRTIRAHTNIELEFFIHGALCVSLSGRCYLSYATQKRSANRGECAQPCRLPYSLYHTDGSLIAKNRYLLSLKDLNLSPYLKELLDAGITSFKIEGRLKDKAYVVNTTAYYRQKLDELFSHDHRYHRSSSGTSSINFTPDVSKTFNRGFTSYFLNGRTNNIISQYTPKSIGAYLGTVSSVQGTIITLSPSAVVTPGDGICFFTPSNVLEGTRVQKVEGERIFLAENKGIQRGTVLYRNYDASFSKELNRMPVKRKIAVEIEFRETSGTVELRAVDEDGIAVWIVKQVVPQKAEHPELIEQRIRAQLLKSGETQFSIQRITLTLHEQYYYSHRLLNEMRRDLLKRLEEERVQYFKTQKARRKDKREVAEFPVKSLDYSYNVANRLAQAFYKRHGVLNIEPAMELSNDVQGKVVMTTKHCLRYYFQLCRGKRGENTPLLLRDAQFTYRLEFDCQECFMRVIFEGKARG